MLRIETINIKAETDVTELIKQLKNYQNIELNSKVNLLHLIKVEFDEKTKVQEASIILNNLNDQMRKVAGMNYMLVPTGVCGIKDITVDNLLIIDD